MQRGRTCVRPACAPVLSVVPAVSDLELSETEYVHPVGPPGFAQLSPGQAKFQSGTPILIGFVTEPGSTRAGKRPAGASLSLLPIEEEVMPLHCGDMITRSCRYHSLPLILSLLS
jgi:hypothetical protein